MNLGKFHKMLVLARKDKGVSETQYIERLTKAAACGRTSCDTKDCDKPDMKVKQYPDGTVVETVKKNVNFVTAFKNSFSTDPNRSPLSNEFSREVLEKRQARFYNVMEFFRETLDETFFFPQTDENFSRDGSSLDEQIIRSRCGDNYIEFLRWRLLDPIYREDICDDERREAFRWLLTEHYYNAVRNNFIAYSSNGVIDEAISVDEKKLFSDMKRRSSKSKDRKLERLDIQCGADFVVSDSVDVLYVISPANGKCCKYRLPYDHDLKTDPVSGYYIIGQYRVFVTLSHFIVYEHYDKCENGFNGQLRLCLKRRTGLGFGRKLCFSLERTEGEPPKTYNVLKAVLGADGRFDFYGKNKSAAVTDIAVRYEFDKQDAHSECYSIRNGKVLLNGSVIWESIWSSSDNVNGEEILLKGAAVSADGRFIVIEQTNGSVDLIDKEDKIKFAPLIAPPASSIYNVLQSASAQTASPDKIAGYRFAGEILVYEYKHENDEITAFIDLCSGRVIKSMPSADFSGIDDDGICCYGRSCLKGGRFTVEMYTIKKEKGINTVSDIPMEWNFVLK